MSRGSHILQVHPDNNADQTTKELRKQLAQSEFENKELIFIIQSFKKEGDKLRNEAIEFEQNRITCEQNTQHLKQQILDLEKTIVDQHDTFQP